MDYKKLLRNIPKMDVLLNNPQLRELNLAPAVLRDLARQKTDALRKEILAGERETVPTEEELVQDILHQAGRDAMPSLREVINATGIPLHTNLGRACLSHEAAEAARQAGERYSTLEFDLETGTRGSRYSHVEELLCTLTGAEAALVVNNNAASVLLILSAMGSGGEVIVSRGELVEIGGSFRIPEIMEQCGCKLREVGATNKTHLHDYRRAISEETKALLKVHTSNYRIVGFSESTPLAELTALGRETGLPVIEDLGSGSLIDLNQFGIADEPTVMDSVKAGVDVICFSGDKLLGGPQAGIIIGRKHWIDQLKIHPLNRALRVDKLTLAALEATLRSYADPKRAVEEIPTLRMLSASPEHLRERAETLCGLMTDRGLTAQVIPNAGQVGGGSVPCQLLQSYAVAVTPKGTSADRAEYALRMLERPIISRISHDQLLFDVRTIWDCDMAYVAEAVERVLA